jgi:chemotaxis family two-component system sensor kinase Cph1
MARLIDGLLAYAQIEAMESTPIENADVEQALGEALQRLDLSIREFHATITHDALPSIHGNQSQITQLFQNLISNAIKYRSAEDPRIHVAASKTAKEWVFAVSDNGQGIAPEFRTKIFGVFTRLHGNEVSGAGLGLAFCSKIVELHRGRIWAEGNPAPVSGSTFFFAIPI